MLYLIFLYNLYILSGMNMVVYLTWFLLWNPVKVSLRGCGVVRILIPKTNEVGI